MGGRARPAGGRSPPARFDRDLDWRWRRTSYSDITAGAYEARVASEPEERVVDDEETIVRAAAAAPPLDDDLESAAMRGVPSLLAQMPVGVQVGTFVHRVFEATDFAAPDLDAELGEHVAATMARRSVDVGDPATVDGGPARRHRDAARAAARRPRRCETSSAPTASTSSIFELPLVGGDQPTGA